MTSEELKQQYREQLIKELDEEAQDKARKWVKHRGGPGSMFWPLRTRSLEAGGTIVDVLNRYLESGPGQLDDMVKQHLTHLTAESCVLNPKYRELFTAEQLQRAWENLDGAWRRTEPMLRRI
jgi:hypothetical protein